MLILFVKGGKSLMQTSTELYIQIVTYSSYRKLLILMVFALIEVDFVALMPTFCTADFRYALVLEPTNKRAALSADRLRKLYQ